MFCISLPQQTIIFTCGQNYSDLNWDGPEIQQTVLRRDAQCLKLNVSRLMKPNSISLQKTKKCKKCSKLFCDYKSDKQNVNDRS